jgi:hypothetical protein
LDDRIGRYFGSGATQHEPPSRYHLEQLHFGGKQSFGLLQIVNIKLAR